MPVQSVLIAERYQLLERLGTGAMGEVWKAQDRRFEQRFVAIKLLKEDETRREEAANREHLERMLRDESDEALSAGLAATLLDEALQSGKGPGAFADRLADRADRNGRFSHQAVLALFDALLDDTACSESARLRAKLRRLFRDEANSVANLRHDNIVSISDYGDHEGVPFLAMDYIEGQTLLRVIQRNERLDRVRQLRIMEDLCSGLAYAHKRHLVHRDIKPANLIIEKGTGSLKILDFGVVRRLQDAPESTMGLPVGTLCYMSPEQISGTAVDHRSDIFSVGVVFYELLSGQKAFPVGNGMTDLMARIQRMPPPPIDALVPDLAPELHGVLDRALEKAPEHRYQDLTEMQRDLARLRMQIEMRAERDDQTVVPGRGDETVPIRDRQEPLIPRLLRRGERALEVGEPAVALETARQVLALDPANAAAQDLQQRGQQLERERGVERHVADGRERLDRGDLTAARASVERARTFDPQAPAVLDLDTAVGQAERERDAARARAARLSELSDRARQMLADRRFADALAAAREALALDPDNDDAQTLAAAAEAGERARQREEGIARLLEDADRAHERSDADAVVEALTRAAELDPARADVQARLAQARDRRDQERARARAEAEATVVLQRADDLLRADRSDEAATLLAREETRHPRIAERLRVVRADEQARHARLAKEAEERAGREARSAQEAEAARIREDEARARADEEERQRRNREDAARLAENHARQQAELEAERTLVLHREAEAEAERTRIAQRKAEAAEQARAATQPAEVVTDSIQFSESTPTDAIAPAANDRDKSIGEHAVTVSAWASRPIVWAAAALVVVLIGAGAYLGMTRHLFGTGSQPDGGAPTATTPATGGGTAAGASGADGGGTQSTNGSGAAASSQPAPVTVDLRPWARVHFVGLDGAAAPAGEFVTPFVVPLPPGKYRLEAENGGLTRPLRQEFEVVAGQPKTVNADMPGFSRDRVIDQILGPAGR